MAKEEMSENADSIRVLIASDNRALGQFIVESVLTSGSYEPILVSGRVAGLRKGLSRSPDLILLDCESSRQDGLGALTALQGRPLQIPVILLTAQASVEIPVAFLRLGVRDFVVKPLTKDAVLESIQRVMFEMQLRREQRLLMERLARTRQQLKQRLVELNVLHRLGESVTAPLPLEVLLERIADAALYLTGAEECTLTLADPETGRLREQVSRWPTRGAVRPLDAQAKEWGDKESGVAAMLHMPLRVASREVGVLSVSNKGTPRTFSQHQRKRLRILADYAAVAIENLRLQHQTAQPQEQEKS